MRPLALALLTACTLPTPSTPPAPALDAALPHADAEATPPAPAPPPLRIGSFNVRRLGLEPHKDLTRLADIITLHFDVLIVLEVMQTDAGGHPGLDALLHTLSAHADFQPLVTATPRPRTASPYAEHYAVLYRPSRVTPCAHHSTLVHVSDHDGSASGTGADRFLREPALACFETVTAMNEARSDFLLLAYHARWGNGDAHDIAAEVAHLDGALAEVRAMYPDEQDVLLLGDLNLAPETVPLQRAEPRTRGVGSTLGADGSPTAHLYDQLWVATPRATRELAGDAWVLDVRDGAGAAYRERISDHLPIVALWRTDLGDDD